MNLPKNLAMLIIVKFAWTKEAGIDWLDYKPICVKQSYTNLLYFFAANRPIYLIWIEF